MKNYITIKEIIKICNIPEKTVNIILEKHKIDTFKSKKGLTVNFKDFYKVYTTLYNPSLFHYTEKNNGDNKKLDDCPKFGNFESLFLYIFKRPNINYQLKK